MKHISIKAFETVLDTVDTALLPSLVALVAAGVVHLSDEQKALLSNLYDPLQSAQESVAAIVATKQAAGKEKMCLVTEEGDNDLVCYLTSFFRAPSIASVY